MTPWTRSARLASVKSWTEVLASKPTVIGKSKYLYSIDERTCVVKLRPTLRTFTYDRDEIVEGSEVLRLDFFEHAASVLTSAGIPVAFQERIAHDAYLAHYCKSPPFETIVKNVAVGSTQRKYPGLFPPGHRFYPPVVKFDYRIDPEDEPISDDYLVAYGLDPDAYKQIALATNEVLKRWLLPNDLLDFCLVLGVTTNGELMIASEISPDCMRLRSPCGHSLDKDIFRLGGSHDELLAAWQKLIRELAL